jgi:hypothetical protein
VVRVAFGEFKAVTARWSRFFVDDHFFLKKKHSNGDHPQKKKKNATLLQCRKEYRTTTFKRHIDVITACKKKRTNTFHFFLNVEA